MQRLLLANDLHLFIFDGYFEVDARPQAAGVGAKVVGSTADGSLDSAVPMRPHHYFCRLCVVFSRRGVWPVGHILCHRTIDFAIAIHAGGHY